MSNSSPCPVAEAAGHSQIARQIMRRRQLRVRFFDSQFFGEHGWDLLLHLFACSPASPSLQEASDALGVSPSTASVMARMLGSHGLVRQGDSDGGWADIPLLLTDEGQSRVQAYLVQVHAEGLAA